MTRVVRERHVGELQEKHARLLMEAAEISVALDQAKGTIQGVPRYAVIESRARELGQQLSRQIQRRHLDAMTSRQAARAPCPGCETYGPLHPAERTVISIDGAVTLPKQRGDCPRCRRAFSPFREPLGFDARERMPVLDPKLANSQFKNSEANVHPTVSDTNGTRILS